MQQFLKHLFLLLAFVGFGSVRGQETDKYKQFGDSMLAAGEAKELIAFFENEIKENPNEVFALRWLGWLYIDVLPDRNKAEMYYLKAVEIDSACHRCYSNLSNIYLLQDNAKKALKFINIALGLSPEEGTYYLLRALIYDAMGNGRAAYFDFGKAVSLEPDNPIAYVESGKFHKRQGFASMAIDNFTKAIELDSANPFYYQERAYVYYNNMLFAEAKADVDKMIELDNTQASFYGMRAILNEMEERFDLALEDYVKAMSMDSNNYIFYMNRANLRYKMEDMDGSCLDHQKVQYLYHKNKLNDLSVLKHMQESLEDICDSANASFFYQRGIALYNKGRFEEAVEQYNQGLKKFPQHTMLLSFKANALLASNEFDSAIVYYDKTLENKQHFIEDAQQNYRYRDAERGKVKEYEKGTFFMIHYSKAESYFYKGDYENALNSVQLCIEQMPGIKEIPVEIAYNVRGLIYLALGEYNKALSDFNRSISLNSSFAPAYVNRAIVKMNLADKVKIVRNTVSANIKNQPLSYTWSYTSNNSLKESESKLRSAVQDCNKAIELESEYGYAYYIRAKISHVLNAGNLCPDLYKAKSMGIIIEPELLLRCSF